MVPLWEWYDKVTGSDMMNVIIKSCGRGIRLECSRSGGEREGEKSNHKKERALCFDLSWFLDAHLAPSPEIVE